MRVFLSLLGLLATVASVGALAPKAPKVTLSVYEESTPMLYSASLVYATAKVLKSAREEKIELKIPEGSPLTPEVLAKYQDESCDFREFNNGNGLSFAELNALLSENQAAIADSLEKNEFITKGKETFNMELFGNLMKYFAAEEGHGGIRPNEVYLSTYRSVKSRFSCVYGIIKDTYNKRIIVAFRGSQGNPLTTRDWQTNVNFRLEELPTPEKIKDKMKGKLKKRILVHDGFYNYLNENVRLENAGRKQRLDQIMEEVKSLLEGEEGYSFYVTGHSLGGALATLFSFQVAGEGPKYDFLPRPVNVVTYAAPFSGTDGYRKAYEQMEIDGLIRHLRIVVDKDLVPALAPTSVGLRVRTMKHAGIQLRLNKKGYELRHSSRDGLGNKFKNTIFKNFPWEITYYHDLELYDERMFANYDDLSSRTLDELYKDPKIVGKEFLKKQKSGSDEL